MKKIVLLLGLLLGLFAGTASAQFKLDAKQANRTEQPSWGPVGYHYASFYYLPELDIYYDVLQKQFVIPNGSKWVYTSTLPVKYHGVNLYNTYKVVFQDDNNQPFVANKKHQKIYKSYRKNYSQVPIAASVDNRYKV